MLSKIYIETTNICNLNCSFCHGTKRPLKTMTFDEFKVICDKIQGKAKYLYLHLMGEPLINPNLPEMVKYAKNHNFEIILTTNGTLLDKNGDFVYKSGNIKKVSISLQAIDKSNKIDVEKYMSSVIEFAKKCSENNVICVLRLWNLKNGQNDDNEEIIKILFQNFNEEWQKSRQSFKLYEGKKSNIYLEFGENFEWPDIDGKEKDVSYCHAIRDQVGILCDGTVVPCCLDADAKIPLGNIFEQTFDEIILSEKAQNIKKGFEQRKVTEKLCKTCGFATQFNL